MLHALLAAHVRTFLARAEERGGVPRFVERELLRFLECGIPAHGFVRVHCKGCGLDRVVAFTVDVSRCPRCAGRVKIVSTVMDPTVAHEILTCIGLPARPPPVAPARDREQGELGSEG